MCKCCRTPPARGGLPPGRPCRPRAPPPSPRAYAIAAHSAGKNLLFVFGGVDASNAILTDLWQLSNADGTGGTPTWTNLTIAGAAPSPKRTQMSGVYDESDDVLVFFGGINCGESSCTQMSDTYAVTDLLVTPTWQPLSPSGTRPPGRFLHSSVYDPARREMIIFGGNDTTAKVGSGASNLDDAWVLTNATGVGGTPAWRELVPPATARPGARMGHAAVLDADHGRMIVFGGTDTGNHVMSDTWILAGLDSGAPRWLGYETGTPRLSDRASPVAAYAGGAVNRMIVAFGEEGGNARANDTWVLHHANGLPTTPISRITIAAASTTVCVSNSVQLTATAADAAGTEVVGVVFVWVSSDTTVATVDGDGTVMAVAGGTVTITVTDEGGTISDSITITTTETSSSEPDGGTGLDCTCYCGWPANQVCQHNSDCPPDESVPGTSVPGVCGCPITPGC